MQYLYIHQPASHFVCESENNTGIGQAEGRAG